MNVRNSSHDYYVLHADALTCLGHGDALFNALNMGRSGLSVASDVFDHPAIDEHGGHVGILPQVTGEDRLGQIFELAFATIIPSALWSCDLIIGACSVGDLVGDDAGNPRAALSRSLSRHCPPTRLVPPHVVVSSACSSGTDAVSLAAQALSTGLASAVGILAFDSLGAGKLMQHVALGTQSRDRARPFDTSRSGTSFGEACACKILANSYAATRLKLPIMGRVVGYGASADAHDVTAPNPHGTYVAEALQRACIGVEPGNIGYINAHGSGTRLNDLAETKAIELAFSSEAKKIPVSSTKGALGHTLGATGLVEAVVTMNALKRSELPPVYGLVTPDPDITLNLLRVASPSTKPYAASVTLGFGGVNSAILLEAA